MPRGYGDGWRNVDPKTLSAIAAPASSKGNKFHAKKVVIDGERFDSKHEGAVWQQLRAEQLASLITGLRRQRRFPLMVPSKHDNQWITVGHYTADFVCHREGRLEVIDAKSRATRTEAYQLRKRLFEALYGLQIREM